MKILFIYFVLITSNCFGQNVELIHKTYSKLKIDNKSFEQFAFYGFCNCTDKFLYSETFEHNYITTFNHLEPFPRLFEKDSMKEVLEKYQYSHKKKFKKIQNIYFNGYLIISKCNEIYNVSNKNLRKTYDEFISKQTLQKEWLESDMKDYLENYFIKIQTE